MVRSLHRLPREDVVSPSLEVFRLEDQAGWSLEQPSLVEGVPAQGRQLEKYDL